MHNLERWIEGISDESDIDQSRSFPLQGYHLSLATQPVHVQYRYDMICDSSFTCIIFFSELLARFSAKVIRPNRITDWLEGEDLGVTTNKSWWSWTLLFLFCLRQEIDWMQSWMNYLSTIIHFPSPRRKILETGVHCTFFLSLLPGHGVESVARSNNILRDFTRRAWAITLIPSYTLGLWWTFEAQTAIPGLDLRQVCLTSSLGRSRAKWSRYRREVVSTQGSFCGEEMGGRGQWMMCYCDDNITPGSHYFSEGEKISAPGLFHHFQCCVRKVRCLGSVGLSALTLLISPRATHTRTYVIK